MRGISVREFLLVIVIILLGYLTLSLKWRKELLQEQIHNLELKYKQYKINMEEEKSIYLLVSKSKNEKCILIEDDNLNKVPYFILF